MKTTMTTSEKVPRTKLSLLELAQKMGNVSKACKAIGYLRQQFYEIRRNYQTYGSARLLDRIPGAKSPQMRLIFPRRPPASEIKGAE